MPHDPRKLLEEIRLAATRIQRFTAGETAEGYATSDLLQSAFERQFEIAAEALSRLLKLAPDAATRMSDYRRIIDFCNLLRDGYDLVDAGIVCDVVQKNLPVLRREVEEMLASLGESEQQPE